MKKMTVMITGRKAATTTKTITIGTVKRTTMTMDLAAGAATQGKDIHGEDLGAWIVRK